MYRWFSWAQNLSKSHWKDRCSSRTCIGNNADRPEPDYLLVSRMSRHERTSNVGDGGNVLDHGKVNRQNRKHTAVVWAICISHHLMLPLARLLRLSNEPMHRKKSDDILGMIDLIRHASTYGWTLGRSIIGYRAEETPREIALLSRVQRRRDLRSIRTM